MSHPTPNSWYLALHFYQNSWCNNYHSLSIADHIHQVISSSHRPYMLLEIFVSMACPQQRYKKYFTALLLLNSCMLPALGGVSHRPMTNCAQRPLRNKVNIKAFVLRTLQTQTTLLNLQMTLKLLQILIMSQPISSQTKQM